MREAKRWEQVLYQVGFLCLGLVVLVPLWMLVQMAFDQSLMGWPLHFRIVPKVFSLEAFAHIWRQAGQSVSFLDALRNSLIVSGGSALLAVGLGASMAYAFARYRFSGRRIGMYGLLLGVLLPPVALMTPLYVLLTILQIRTSLLGLVVVYTSFSMPFCVWNMRAAFQTTPRELEEAAFIDGAGQFMAFLRVALPVAMPSIAVAGLMAFLTGYTEFVMAWLFIDSSSQVTLAMALTGMIGSGGTSWNLLAALALLMSLPVVIVFLLLQRYILNNLLLGSPGG